MSLRDQLLAKGIATKKDARRAANQARVEERKRRGEQKKRGAKARVEAERAAAAELERLAEERAVKRRTQAALDALEASHQLHMLIENNRVGRRGRVPFHHRSVDGATLPRLWVDEATARRLLTGHLAIAGYLRSGGEARYTTVSSQGASMLDQRSPESIVFWVREAVDPADPVLRAGRAVSEPSLKPRRID